MQKMSSQESPQRSAEDDGKEGSQRKNTKRKRPLGKEKVLLYFPDLTETACNFFYKFI